MPWRDDSNLHDGFTSYEEKFKHVETELLTKISSHDCFYGVYYNQDPINMTYGSVDQDDKE